MISHSLIGILTVGKYTRNKTLGRAVICNQGQLLLLVHENYSEKLMGLSFPSLTTTSPRARVWSMLQSGETLGGKQ